MPTSPAGHTPQATKLRTGIVDKVLFRVLGQVTLGDAGILAQNAPLLGLGR